MRHVGLRKVFLVFLEFREQPGIPVFEGTSGGSRLQAAGCRLCMKLHGGNAGRVVNFAREAKRSMQPCSFGMSFMPDRRDA